MKKYCFLGSIIFIIFITGCSAGNNTFEKVVSVNYKNIILLEDDMKNIVAKINDVNFNTKSAIDVLEEDISPLIIETDDVKYEFVFVESSICYKDESDSTGSYICGKVEKIEAILDDYFTLYTSENFSISFDNSYIEKDGTIVDYEKTDESIIIELNEEVESVSIYKSTLDSDNNVVSGDVIYEEKNINGKVIIKTTPSEAIPKMLIRIVNKYGVSFVYMPTYNGKTGEIDFYSPTS